MDKTKASSGLIILTTTPNQQSSTVLAKALVEKHLAACVNIIGPVQSIYSWEAKLVNDSEYKLFIKTSSEKRQAVCQFIRDNHEYTLPEITVLSVQFDNPDYEKWLNTYVGSVS